MIALAAPRFKWPHLTSSRLISPRLAWPGRGLCYVSTRQQLKMLLDWHCNGKRAGGGAGAVDVPHANAGHRREFKSHLYNRLLRVVFWLFSFADGLQMQPTHAQREISL